MAATTIAARLDTARRDLLDLGTRNPLIAHRPSKVRGVQVADELPAEVWRVLVREEQAMTFAPAKDGAEPAPATPLPEEPLPRHRDRILQTAHPAAALQSRLLATARDARLAVEEMGVGILHLAIGFLAWREDDAPADAPPRRAPLLLVPVQLARGDAASRFTLAWTGEELTANLSLEAKLKAEHGITLPALPPVEDLDPVAWLAQVQSAVAAKPGWTVEQAIRLDLFSFARFLMYRDLDPATWPEGARPDQHAVVCGVFGQGFPAAPAPSSAPPVEVVDADGSQREALALVAAGATLVIQGPPGTGKSQTITNLVAQAVAQGKTVLFVAEKLAALEVVKRRLDAVGLGDACLELHSDKASRRGVAVELKRTLSLGRVREPDGDAPERALAQTAAELDALHAAVHGPLAGTTPCAEIARLLDLSVDGADTWPVPDIPALAQLDADAWRTLRSATEDLQAVIARTGSPAALPFAGSQLDRLAPADEAPLRNAIASATAAWLELLPKAISLAHDAQLREPANPSDIAKILMVIRLRSVAPPYATKRTTAEAWNRDEDVKKLLHAAAAWSDFRVRHDSKFIPEAWDAEVVSLRGDILAYGQGMFRFLSSNWRSAKSKLGALLRIPVPGDGDACLALVETLLEGRRLSNALATHDALGRELFGDLWRGPSSDTKHLGLIAAWTGLWRRSCPGNEIPADGPVPETTSVDAAWNTWVQASENLTKALVCGSNDILAMNLAARLDAWRDLGPLHDTVAVNRASAHLRSAGAGALADAAASWPDASRLLVRLADAARARAVLARAATERPVVASFDPTSHERLQDRFAQLEQEVQGRARARLAAQHWRGIPGGGGVGQVGLLRRECEKKARHLPLRTLLREAGDAIQAMKPVFMMSPISVAAHLDPGGLRFDLVVFDEASQVRPVDAIGCLARARQAVVVGDSRQMPPTSFFDRLVGGDEETADEDGSSRTRDLESLLALMEAGGAPTAWLRWHYRSRHPSLIATSNRAVYDGRLLVFPSPAGTGSGEGLSLVRVAGTYDRSKSRINQAEADAVAAAVIDHARTNPKRSLGACAFSQAQAQAIAAAVERARRDAPDAEGFFAAHPFEPFFVKNLENVQGDERDTMLISVGYGRDASGAVALNFGPLNLDGGERRLNVLITRARRRMTVYTNLGPEDIDPARTDAKGVLLLREFLTAAARGGEDAALAAGTADPFASAVGRMLAPAATARTVALGGLALRVENATGQPLGVIAEDPTPGTTRDRERLRREVLTGLGWRLHRAWPLAWWRRPQDERKQLLTALAGNAPAPTPKPAPATAVIRDPDALPPGRPAPPAYMPTTLTIPVSESQLTQLLPGRIAELVETIVRDEGPIHPDTIVERLLEAAKGRSPDPAKTDAWLRAGIREAVASSRCVERDGFLALPGARPLLRDRSDLPIDERRTPRISTDELALAIAEAVRAGCGLTLDEAPAAAARLLGLGRASDGSEPHWQAAIAAAVVSGAIIRRGDRAIPAAVGSS